MIRLLIYIVVGIIGQYIFDVISLTNCMTIVKAENYWFKTISIWAIRLANVVAYGFLWKNYFNI